MKILTVCPTRGRVEVCRKMVNSFLETSTNSDLMLVIDQDDDVDSYIKISSDQRVRYFVNNTQVTTTEMFNKSFRDYDLYEFYHQTNDDFIYRTPGWDIKFMETLNINNGGIAYGNDLLQRHRMCTAPIISGEIIRSLGWLQMPLLTHLGGDCVWMYLGQRLNKLFYVEGVIIEHMHYQANKCVIDKTYLKTNSGEMYVRDQKAFQQWIEEESERDIEKIRLGLFNMSKTSGL